MRILRLFLIERKDDPYHLTKIGFRPLSVALCSLSLFLGLVSNVNMQVGAASTIDLNSLMKTRWDEWDSLLTRWMDTNGTIVDLYDYSRRSRGQTSNVSLSSFGTYLLALTNMYEQTSDEYYLTKLRYIVDAMIESTWFHRDVAGIGTIFYTPHWWYDNAEREPAPIYVGDVGFVTVKLWKWTGEIRYKQLADRIANETIKLAAVHNATDMAWSHAYYSGRDEANAKLGVNRQAAITMFYSVYAKEINNTYYTFVAKTLHWQFKAQLESGGLCYSIGDTTENRPYAGFHMVELLHGYLTSPIGYADYAANIQNALALMQSTKASYSYAEEYFVLGALILAWKNAAFAVNANLTKTYTFIGLNVLNHTLYGEFSVSVDNAHGWRWSQFGLGSFFSSYPLPDGTFDAFNLFPIIDCNDLNNNHKDLVYYWDTSQGIDRVRYNASYGVGLFHSNGLLKGLYFQFGSNQGAPISTISKNNHYVHALHQWDGNNNVNQYVYSFFTFFNVEGSRDFEILQEAQNIMQATLANGTTITLNNLFNSTASLTESFVIYYSAQNSSRFFVWSPNTTWSLYNQTGYSRLRTTVTDGKVLVARLFRTVDAMKTHDAFYQLVPYRDLLNPLTFEQVLQAYKDVKNKLGDLMFGATYWKQVYSSATNGTVRLLMHNRPQETSLTAWSLETERLAFTISSTVGVTSTAKIYVADRGKPTSLFTNNVRRLEGSGWIFDNATKAIIVEVASTGSGQTEIVVDWRIPGDVNSDGAVDLLDLSRLAKTYGASQGEPTWNGDADFNRDGAVNQSDLETLAQSFGKRKPCEFLPGQ